MDQPVIDRHLRRQRGLISRSQVQAAGGSDSDIERLVRRRDLTRVYAGVFADHTGRLTWDQRAWAAVLYHRPAALAGASALRAYGVTGAATDHGPIQVAVAFARRVTDPPGVRSVRLTDYDKVVRPGLSPPRVHIEHAALSVAGRCGSEDAAVAVLGDVCQQGLTTPERLRKALRQRTRLRHRSLLGEVLDDVACGANSALERRYLVQVERAHGFPEGARQFRVVRGARTAYQDVRYPDQQQILELDGRLGHDGTADRWADLARDLMSAQAGEATTRIGWGQVLEPCRLAGSVGGLLRSRGWSGRPVPCGPGCVVRIAA